MNQLLQNAAYGTALILLVLALRRVLQDRLDPRARLALWGVCLFRLLTPNPPESVLSLWGLVGRLEAAEAGTQSAPAAPAPGPVYVLEPGMPIAPAVPAAAPTDPAAVPAAFPWGTVLTAVWLAVGGLLAVWYLVGWVRARRAVSCAIPVGEDDPRRRFLPRFAQLREGPVEGAPLTFGVVRPKVVLSPGLNEGELVCVLAHEGVHARRRDNLWHYVMAAALVVYWWDPAVWLMSRLLRRDIELACDRAALKQLGEEHRAEYAQALVTLSTQGEGNGPAFCQTFGRKATEERIRSIMKFKKPTIIGVVLTLVLVLGVTIAFASDPKASADEDSGAGKYSLAGDHEDSDAGEYSSEFRCSVYYDGTVVTRVVLSLEMLEEDLEIRMNEHSMSKAEAELILNQAQSIAVDGVIDWTFTEDSGLRHEVLPEKSTKDTTVSANGYWDKDGKFVTVAVSEIVRDFILPQALMGVDNGTLYDISDYTVVEPEIDGQGNSIIRDADGNPVIVGIRSSLPLCDDPDCPMAGDGEHYHDENGVGVRVQVHFVVPGLLCTRAGCTASGAHEHSGVSYDACAATCTPEQYASALDAWVALGAMDRQEADGWLENFRTCYDQVQKGELDAFAYNIYDGARIVPAYYKSERAELGYHVNSKGETYGPDMPEVYGSSPDLILALGANGEVGYVRNSDDPGYCVRNPEEAMIYMEWRKTQPSVMYVPLYDSEGNVTGRFAMSNGSGYDAGAGGSPEDVPTAMEAWLAYLESREQPASQPEIQNTATYTTLPMYPVYPVCDVDGCTIEGRHDHNGVIYCGGAAHNGKVCDGSCIYQTVQRVVSSSHHEEEPVSCPPEAIDRNVSTGHHSGSHH